MVANKEEFSLSLPADVQERTTENSTVIPFVVQGSLLLMSFCFYMPQGKIGPPVSSGFFHGTNKMIIFSNYFCTSNGQLYWAMGLYVKLSKLNSIS